MAHIRFRPSWFFSALALWAALLFLGEPVHAQSADASAVAWERAVGAQRAHAARLLATHGVVGTAIGVGADGEPTVVVYLESAGVRGLPSQLHGVPVEAVVTGTIHARHHCKGGHFDPETCGEPPSDPPADSNAEPSDPKAEFPRPVPIGVSAGSERLIQIEGALYCTTGTLGFRAMRDGGTYAVSNAHVFAQEGAFPFGPGNRILQPGRADLEGCGDPSAFPDLAIGTLGSWVPIAFGNSSCTTEPSSCNRVDAARAEVDPSTVGVGTPSNGYGAPTKLPVAIGPELIGLEVQKYGRTTGLTSGRIAEVNAIVNVAYDKGVATFSGQIRVVDDKRGMRDTFSASGDSGSLIVTREGNHPVGLLFAGGTFATFANPIAEVLTALDVEVDGAAAP